MINLNRILCLMFVGFVLMDVVLTVLLGQPASELLYVPFVIPIVMALLGRGGKLFYYFALISTLLISLELVVFVLTISEDIAGAIRINYADPGLHVTFLAGALGLAAYFCISRTHPMAGIRTALDRKLRGLRESFMFSSMVILGNAIIMLVVSVTNQDWSYPEVIWVYWFDTLIVSLFSARTLWQLKDFDVSGITDIPGDSDEAIKKGFIKDYMVAYMAFMVIYAALFLFLLRIPTLLNTGFMLLLVVVLLISHFYESRLKQQELATRCVNLQQLQYAQGYRLLPIHLTLMFALPAYIAGESAERDLIFLVLFIIIKTFTDLLMEALGYRKSRILALENYV